MTDEGVQFDPMWRTFFVVFQWARDWADTRAVSQTVILAFGIYAQGHRSGSRRVTKAARKL